MSVRWALRMHLYNTVYCDMECTGGEEWYVPCSFSSRATAARTHGVPVPVAMRSALCQGSREAPAVRCGRAVDGVLAPTELARILLTDLTAAVQLQGPISGMPPMHYVYLDVCVYI